MHSKLKAVIDDITTTIKMNAAELKFELSQEQSEQVLAQALNAQFELNDTDLRSIILDVLDKEPSDEITIEHVSLALLGIDAMFSIIKQSKPYQRMLKSEHYCNVGDGSIFNVLKELGNLHASIRDYKEELSMDKNN